ncbi:hypothetical protein [Paracandidimonas lactea]|uniref:hypothetical protein n=1 Tax=Paracandidimonas lactea TaxID=2895524 RepID=UPI001F40CB78|nr:hypothetical protein [Paracandidimonas lactea]
MTQHLNGAQRPGSWRAHVPEPPGYDPTTPPGQTPERPPEQEPDFPPERDPDIPPERPPAEDPERDINLPPRERRDDVRDPRRS